MNSLRYLIPMPILQIVIVCFALSGEAPRMFLALFLATSVGFLTFYFIRELNKKQKPDWFSLLYPCFVTTGILTLPIGLWFLLYTGGTITTIVIPFLIILPAVMSLFELNFIFRNLRKT